MPLAKEMVRNGLGCTVLPFATVRDEVERGSLSFRSIEHDPLVTVHAIVSRYRTTPAPFNTIFRCFLAHMIFDLATSGVWAGTTGLMVKSTGEESHPMLEAAIA